MATEIKVLFYGNKPIRDELDIGQESFWCLEEPSYVLEKLMPKYNIQIFNNLDTNLGTPIKIPSRTNIMFCGLSIKKFQNTSGLYPTEYLRNWETKLPENDFRPILRQQKVLEKIVRNYLIDTITTESGSETLGPGGRVISSTPSKRKIVNYLDIRKQREDKRKELFLKDILVYGTNLYEGNFGLEDLKKLAKKVEKNMPKTGQPERTYFATLKPSSGI